MHRKSYLRFAGLVGLAVLVAALPWGINQAFGNAGPAGVTFYANSMSGGASGTVFSKFIDSLPGLGPANANTRGQYIPLAVADTTTFPGCDYYRLGIMDFTQRLHRNSPKATKLRGYVDLGTGAPPSPHYLGPLIVAQRDRPVRVLMTNNLGAGAAGNLFIPMDPTQTGAGLGPLGAAAGNYSQNRTSIHLHGAFTPWISDGTPMQWFTPAGETSSYLTGVSYRNVPDMPNPGAGSQTLYYTNQHSGRLMFYHEHAEGITRLGVYCGLAAGYLLHDPVEDDLIDGTNNTGVNPGLQKIIPDQGGGVYKWGIPLIIQDRSFVPLDIATQDSKWDTVNWGTYGDLWYPHIYEPNQSLTDPTGMNAYGRWDFGPWVQPNILAPIDVQAPELKAALPLPGTDVNNPQNYTTSIVPEAFMDTMMTNGELYPYLNVQPTAYRFRILNACNDRFLNLQLYLDASGGGIGATATAVVNPATGAITAIGLTNGGSGYVRPPGININGGGGFGAMATATITGGVVTAITVTNPGSGYTSAPVVTIGAKTEVSMVAAVPNGFYPPTWPKDGRDGGVPDPATAGPKFIQIGTEGGILPGVAVRDNQPVNYDYDRGSATFGNVQNLEGVDPAIKGVTVFLGPAERADVIVDFSGVPSGTNVILYNDAGAPVPGFQPRYDYYTGNPDLTSTGGAIQTKVGVGPNTRTIMQFRVLGTPTAPFNLAALQTALPVAYVASQPPPIIPQTYYPGAYHAATDTHGHINDTQLTWTPVGGIAPVTKVMEQKAIVELFEQYGRMNATLGYEIFDPTTIPARSNGVGFSYMDPPVEVFHLGETQIWKITHNGVDTHPIHIHLVNAQIINRVGWDGVIKPPEPYERGWKETIRMNPLESIFVGIKADLPTVPFPVTTSVRPLNPSQPLGSTVGFTNINPKTGQPITATPTVNVLYDYGHEFVWHCHILGHEENDMMRPLVIKNRTIPQLYDLLLSRLMVP
jgi:FtsP/CotA-like multicopper oxidase with cupredoxin domain